MSFYDHLMSVVYCMSMVVCRLSVTDNSSYTTESIFIQYCKFRNFSQNFVFLKSVKRHICDIKNSLLGHELPISVVDWVISPFCEGFIFIKLPICEVFKNKTHAKISAFTVFTK